MSEEMYTITDGVGSNLLILFISTYFPFIEEPIILTYLKRKYKVLTTGLREFKFDYFFLSHDCLRCPKNCCTHVSIPIGFERFWSEDKLKPLRAFKPRKYNIYLNDEKMVYYIGSTANYCKYQKKKACTIWDSNIPAQRRPMGCHFFPLSFYWENGTLVFTKYCQPYECKDDPTRYTQADLNRDLNSFEKIIAEVKAIGLTPNYHPLEALKEQSYLTV
ncbi:MAG: hypothetical protein EU536_02700 [Promethearchaeota archaeon]|nr:MAG: hypothetical protein EU536_02700 [Candidatus Lokiarchaeota archaeon]